MCNIINQTLEIFTIVVDVIILISLLLERRKQKLEYTFLAVLLMHIVTTAGDLLAWKFTAMPGLNAVTETGNVLTYVFNPLACTGFCILVFYMLCQPQRVKRVTPCLLSFLVLVLGVVSALLIVVNKKTGILFTLNSENVFTWGPLSMLPDNMLLVQLLLMLPILFLCRTRSRLDTFVSAALYLGTPMAAVLLENHASTLMLVYPSVTISMLLFEVMRQHNKQRVMMQQELELSDSKVRLLMGQIQPHFIFNSLLAIQELCAEDPKKAEGAVQDFAIYLRGNLDAMSSTRMIPFAKELEHIRHYLSLEQADPSETFQVEYDLAVRDFRVPPLSVQPIVENAVRHGMAMRDSGGVITIATREDAWSYSIIVKDNGYGFDSATQEQMERKSIGLENVRMRLAAQCHGSLEIDSGEIGTIVRIRIPKKGQAV